jgi:hypothetical protein
VPYRSPITRSGRRGSSRDTPIEGIEWQSTTMTLPNAWCAF